MDLSRTSLMIGEKGIEILRNASVCIFGIGGVGGYAAESIARSGVGHITLIDHDTVSPSNLNRQLIAMNSTIGQEKVAVMAARIKDINPAAEVTVRAVFCTPENAASLLPTDCSYVIDAVDTVTAKIAIILAAQSRRIPVISCMGAGNKKNPTKFRVADIYETSVCPLCRVMRRELRKRGVEALPVVYSEEEPVKQSDGAPVGSLSFVPGAAGLALAGKVILDLVQMHGE